MKKTLIILLLVIIFSVYNINNQDVIIPDSAIRLRVIPNSNSPIDINIKKQVKDYLEHDIYSLLYDVDNIDIARDIIDSNIITIKENIDEIFSNNNYDIMYNVNFGNNYFPKKIYKGKVYDEGYYESLVISIGEGNGDNFWCVLFPNFCLVDREEEYEYKSYFYELFKKIF